MKDYFLFYIKIWYTYNGDNMNESKGAKGGHNDHKRTLVIKKKQKEQLKKIEEQNKHDRLKQLEKEVRTLQVATFLSAVPLVVAGTTIETIIQKNSPDNNNKKPEKETDTKKKTTKSKDQVLILEESVKKTSIIDEIILKDTKKLITIEPENKLSIKPSEEKEQDVEKKITEHKSIQEVIPQQEINPSKETKKVEVKEVGQFQIPLPIVSLPEQEKLLEIGLEQKLFDVKNQKIIDEYDKKLKDIRTDLKSLIFDYNVIVEYKDKTYESKEVEELLNKLNLIIKRIEALKNKIAIPDMDKYEDPYLYHLVEEYIEEFKDKKIVGEIKDSELYILISEKLADLDHKKDKLNQRLEEKKDKLEVDEEKLEKLKEKYDEYDRFNNTLLKFQAEQDILIKEIETKISTSMTTYEKTEVQVKALELQSKNLLKLLALQMMIPGAKTAKKIALATVSYLYFMKRVIRPKTETKRYRIIEVKNYSDTIEKSLDKIETIEKLLKKTSSSLEGMIAQIKKDYAEYLGVLPECDQLLANLEKVQDSIREKEYELKKSKREQQQNLDKNNEKVKLIKKEEM